MSTPLHVLILEDQPDDVELMLRQLRHAEFVPIWQQVETELDYMAALQQITAANAAVEIILADYTMPRLNALRALQLLQQQSLDIPFLVITGSISEEIAVECMKQGAADYLLKDRLIRLGPAVVQALEQKRLRDLKREAETEREKLIEELDAFAHMVAHDLKNPLGVLIGMALILEANCEKMVIEEVKECLQTMGRNGRKMNNIINELLVLASVRQQDIEMHTLDMSSIIAEARQRLNYIIETHRARIVAPATWPRAWGYGPWVEEVWVNYLSNALKYGGQPPCLELGATEQEDGLVCFWVRDNGLGLTPAEQARLFTPFTRLNQIRVQGHGLGLSIARRIVEKLGGQVGVTSNGVKDQGSVFSFTLPGDSPSITSEFISPARNIRVVV